MGLRDRFDSKPAVREGLTPEEQEAERKAAVKRQRKAAMAKAQSEQEKKDKKLQKRIDHANSGAGVYTSMYKKDNGDISWWRMCFM